MIQGNPYLQGSHLLLVVIQDEEFSINAIVLGDELE